MIGLTSSQGEHLDMIMVFDNVMNVLCNEIESFCLTLLSLLT